MSPASLSDVFAATPKFSVPPTAPVVLVGCAVMFIVLCTRDCATLLVTSAAPSDDTIQR